MTVVLDVPSTASPVLSPRDAAIAKAANEYSLQILGRDLSACSQTTQFSITQDTTRILEASGLLPAADTTPAAHAVVLSNMVDRFSFVS